MSPRRQPKWRPHTRRRERALRRRADRARPAVLHQCHDDQGKSGGLSLEHFDAAKVVQNAEVAEKMIRKLRVGMMPPPAAQDRPDAATMSAFVTALETKLDAAAAINPESRLASVPAPQSRRIRRRRAEPASASTWT